MKFANFIHIDQCIGVSITLSANGGFSVDACKVVRREGKLDIDQKIPACSSLNELFKLLPAKSVIALNLTGRGVVNKQQEWDGAGETIKFDKILPGANPDDFYIQHFVSGNSVFSSVIRKVEADKLLDAFVSAGFKPVMLSLGPFPADVILNQLNNYGEDFIFNGHQIKYNENQEWLSYNYKAGIIAQFPVKADMETLLERMILPYAVAFQVLLTQKIEPVCVEVPVLRSNLTGLLDAIKLKVTGAVILAVFFVLLALNTAIFSWLFTENDRLSAQLSRSSRDTEGIREIEKNVTQDETLLKELGWDGGINKSILIDKIAALLPGGITWKEVYINPVDLQKSRQDKVVRFIDRRVSISGNAAAVLDVNEWIARIKTIAWVKNARLESYTYNNELNTGQFKILLDY
jgi:Tfp pilus assembly protein PilN